MCCILNRPMYLDYRPLSFQACFYSAQSSTALPLPVALIYLGTTEPLDKHDVIRLVAGERYGTGI